jgi:lipoic acid synthetase
MDLEILDWGYLGYQEAFERQLALVEERINGSVPDRLILVEHHPVTTLGRSGSRNDICISEAVLRQKGIEIFEVDRGGQATYHSPGQLVAYPIIRLVDKDLHRYLKTLIAVVAAVLRSFDIKPEVKDGRPGIWVDTAKIASVGIAVKKWVTYHGVALNVNNDLEGFNWIVPCGQHGEIMTSLKCCLNLAVDLNEVKKRFIKEFCTAFSYSTDTANPSGDANRPKWLTKPAPDPKAIHQMERLLDKLRLTTVCQNAACPNLGECFMRGTATFMILGACCTRSCRFCAVNKGTPQKIDPAEPARVAYAAELLKLNHVVITSVTRDDLSDGGAGQFCRTIDAVRARCRQAKIEILIPDFRGSINALQTVCEAQPDIINHNIETVARLYPSVRPGALYRRSLGIIEFAARQRLAAKSGLMLGLGETSVEIIGTLDDLKRAGCRYLTLGQYLAPTPNHYPVARFIAPDEFKEWAARARQMGFVEVASGPLVRSSYRADAMLAKSPNSRRKLQP